MSTSYASSRIREIEHRSASACKYEAGSVIIALNNDDNQEEEKGWKIQSKHTKSSNDRNDDNDNDDEFSTLLPEDQMAQYAAGGEVTFTTNGDDPMSGSSITTKSIVKCMTLASGTTIRVSPMEKSRGGWDIEHFHEHLRLPEGSNVGKGMVVMLEAIGRECVAVALSPYHSFDLGKTYVVHFGANGNLQTVLRRRINHHEAVDASFPSRVCAENFWVPYWIVLQNGKLSAGVGRIPGKQCIGTLDDSMYNMLRSGMDAVRYVGIGNSALGRNARDVRVRNVCVLSIPGCFGLEGIPMEVNDGSAFVNILEDLGRRSRGGGGDFEEEGGNSGAMVPTDAELLAEYEKERAKARARAEKFGIEYKEPAPDAFLKWSEARRLRANPERGFITGIDTFSKEEKAKADARKERFAREERKRKGLDEDDANKIGDDEDEYGRKGEDGEEGMEDEEDAPDDVAEWEKTKRDPLPIDQAWDNWKLVQRFRVDPPKSLYANTGNGEEDLQLSDSYSNDIWHGHGGNEMGNNDEGDGEDKPEFIPKKIVPVPTKIHVFSNDWSAFKQIRSDDLMSYFKDYGPSYVEWLGELSCNILFEDKHSAARAFHALSQELPTPPPEHLKKPRKSREGDEDKDDDDMAGEDNKEDGEAVDMPAEGDDKKQEEEIVLPDFGGMGWRFCKWTVRKVSNDRYGRRGTRARVLMRMANSADILDDRPTEWPRPPPGFTTKRVLMPNNDFKRRHHRGRRDTKRRRRDGRRSNRDDRRDDYDDDDYYYDREGVGGEHPMLSKGLSSGRAGFSVEDLEAEREAKRAAEEDMS